MKKTTPTTPTTTPTTTPQTQACRGNHANHASGPSYAHARELFLYFLILSRVYIYGVVGVVSVVYWEKSVFRRGFRRGFLNCWRGFEVQV
jgi:hypothetical protein